MIHRIDYVVLHNVFSLSVAMMATQVLVQDVRPQSGWPQKLKALQCPACELKLTGRQISCHNSTIIVLLFCQRRDSQSTTQNLSACSPCWQITLPNKKILYDTKILW